MGEEEKQNIVGEVFVEDHERSRRHVHWAANKIGDHEYGHESMESIPISISSVNDSEASSSSSLLSSSLSSEMADDASSSSSDSRGPLYELDELMAQLPIKRGLSKFYNGKSHTFTSLASVNSLEDLAKKESTCGYSKRMKSCKISYGGNLNQHKFGPKATITKRSSSPKGSFSPSLAAKGSSLLLNL